MFKREFKINFKSLILWSLILIILFLIVFLVYPSIINKGNTDAINEMMKAFPKEMLETFNMDLISLESVYGWLKTEGYMLFVLIGGIYSSILGSTILTKEENDKTISFLLSKPVTKTKIINSKILCGILNIVLLTIIVGIFNLIGLAISDDLKLIEYLKIFISPMMIFISLFMISMYVSTFFRKTKTSMSIGIGITFLSYFFQVIGSLSDKVKVFKYFSVFELTTVRQIVNKNSISIISCLIFALILIISYALININYNKKKFFD